MLTKSGRREQAVPEDQRLLERDGGLRDQDGVAFARYAIDQLTRIRADDPTAVARPLSALLSRLETGEEPLTDHTEPLLQDVEDWLTRNPTAAAANGRIPQVIRVLRSRLDLVARDASNIEFFRSNSPASFPMLDLGFFGAVAAEVAGSPRLYLVRRMATGSRHRRDSRSISNVSGPRCWTGPLEYPHGSRWRWTSSRELVSTRRTGRRP